MKFEVRSQAQYFIYKWCHCNPENAEKNQVQNYILRPLSSQL